MAQIGTFTRTKHGFSGRLRTLSLNIELNIVPGDYSDTENAPNYRVHAGDEDGPEVGAGWTRTGEKAGEYVALQIDDPGFRSQSAPTCFSPAATAPHSICSGRAPQNAKRGAEPCRHYANRMSDIRASRAESWSFLCSRKTRLIPPSRSRFTRPSRAAAVKGGRRPALAPCP